MKILKFNTFPLRRAFVGLFRFSQQRKASKLGLVLVSRLFLKIVEEINEDIGENRGCCGAWRPISAVSRLYPSSRKYIRRQKIISALREIYPPSEIRALMSKTIQSIQKNSILKKLPPETPMVFGDSFFIFIRILE